MAHDTCETRKKTNEMHPKKFSQVQQIYRKWKKATHIRILPTIHK